MATRPEVVGTPSSIGSIDDRVGAVRAERSLQNRCNFWRVTRFCLQFHAAVGRVGIKYNGAILPVGSGRIRAGRSKVCEIVLTGSSASRVHAFLRVQDGTLNVVDNQSKNGTFINGTRVVGEQPVAVGDQVRLGSNVLHVVTIESATRSDRQRATTLREIGRNHEEVTTTIDNASVIDLAEVLIENCVDDDRRRETARTVMSAVDELLDRAGFAYTHLDANDAERLRTIADTVATWDSDGSYDAWRKELDRRISVVMPRASVPE